MASRPALFIAIAFALGIWVESMFQLHAVILAMSFGPLLVSAFFYYWRTGASATCMPAALEVASIDTPVDPKSFPRHERQHGIKQKKVERVDVLLLAACLAAGMLRTYFAEQPAKNEISSFADTPSEVLLFGKVHNLPERRAERWQFPLAAQRVRTADGWSAAQGKVLVSGEQLGDVQVGERLLLRGFLRLADASRNPGAFDYRAYLQAQGISAIFRSKDQMPLWREKSSGSFAWQRMIAQARQWIDAQLAKFSQGQRLALLRGLLIGERDEISKEVIEAFARTGLIHILAVSGSNVGFIVLIVFTVLSFLRVPRRWHPTFLLSGIVFYMYLTGAQPPVVRATLMAAVIIIGESLERHADIYNSVGVAALGILLWQPFQLFQLGFQLTFAAVLGIAYLYQPILSLLMWVIRSQWRPLRWAAMLMAVSFAAQLATLPISLYAFGRLPLTAIWGNLVVIPAAFVIVATTTAACTFSFFELVSQSFGLVADVAAGLMIVFTRWLADLPLAYRDGVHVSPWLLIFGVLAMATVVEWRRSRRARSWLLISGLLVLNIFIWQHAWSAGPKLRVTFFDVGQGDAALLEFPKGRLLVDTGPRDEDWDAAERILVPFLRRQGIRQLEAVVISHPHADHLGGLPTLLREIRIKKIFVCGVEGNSPLEQNCEKLLDSLRVPVMALHAGQRITDFAPAQVWALHPRPGLAWVRNLNDASVVLKIIFGQHSFLFPGDAEQESESRLLQFAQLLDSDVLKVGHHGSITSSLVSFINAVSPQWAITSVGRWNRFDQPHPKVMARYDSLGIRLLRTDRDGAVIFETDGRTLKRVR